MLDKGFNYLVYEDKADLVFKLFKEALSEEYMEGFCLTTVFPKKLKKLYGLEKTSLMWLSDSKGEERAVSPSRLDFEIAREMKKFIKEKGDKGVVLLEGLEYLLLANDFDKVRKFVKSVCDLCSTTETTFIVTINPESFNKETTTILSRDFDKVESASEMFPPADASSAVTHLPPQASAPPHPQPHPQPQRPSTPAPPASYPPAPPPVSRPHPPLSHSPPKPTTLGSISRSADVNLQIEDMYLIHRATGILIQRKTWREADLIDPDLIGGMLTAIQDFVNNSFSSGDKSNFTRFDIKGYIIFLYDGELVSLATVLSGEHEDTFVKHMKSVKDIIRSTITRFENEHKPLLQNFDGHVERFKGARNYMDEISVKFMSTISGRASAGVIPERIPDNALEYYNRGVSFSRQKQYQDAIESFDSALEIEPNYPKALFNRAVVLQMTGRVADAIETYRRLTALTPEDSEVWGNLAIALRSLGRTTDALECYDRALAINPNDASLWNNKAIALRSIGKVDEAILCYDQALAINPMDKGLWTNKGVALASTQKYDEAIVCYNQALAIDPGYAKAKHNLEILERQKGGISGLR